MEEFVVIDNKGNEMVPTFVDPVEKHWETKHYWYVDNGMNIYRFWKYEGQKCVVRLKEEEK